jgi:holliday junction DNA helicase RuvA
VIALLRGEVIDRGEGSVVVDVHGVGYRVLVPSGVAIPLPGRGVTLHTSLQVREDSMTLYGFLERDELRLFELLLTSSGVGPKLALAALTALRPAALEAAIAEGDLAVLTGVPGIGRKVAERIVLELKDRVGAAVGAPTGSAASVATGRWRPFVKRWPGSGSHPSRSARRSHSSRRSRVRTVAALLRRALRVLGRGTEGAA